MELKPGQVLEQNYRLESLLGEGGMGAVWKATDLRLGRTVAIKVLHTDLAADPGLNSRFEREARLLASLEHPGIVPIYASLTINDGQGHAFPCIVMQFVKGKPLADVIHQGGPMPLPQAVKLTSALLDALSVAHESGIIHRDLKPHNVILETRGENTQVRLLDFGIAKSLAPESNAPQGAPQTMAGMLLGTPAYMSPEQINNPGKVDARADLWAVGVCFFEMVTGKLPFPGESPIETVSKVLTNQIVPPRQVNPSLPPDVDPVFQRLFHRDLEQRPRNAHEMIQLLQGLVNDKSVAAQPSPWAPQGTGFAGGPSPMQSAYGGQHTPQPHMQQHTPQPGVAQGAYPNTPAPQPFHGSMGAMSPPPTYGQSTPQPGMMGGGYSQQGTPPPGAYGGPSPAPQPSYAPGMTLGAPGTQPAPSAWNAASPSPGYPGAVAPVQPQQAGVMGGPSPGAVGPQGAYPGSTSFGTQPTFGAQQPGYGGQFVPQQGGGATAGLSGKKLAGILGFGVVGSVLFGILILVGAITFLSMIFGAC